MKKIIPRPDIPRIITISQSDYIRGDFIISDDKNIHLSKFPLKIADFVFGICHSGTADIEIDMRCHTIEAKTFMIILPKQIISFISKSKDFSAKYVVVPHDFFNNTQISIPHMLPLFLHVRETPCTKLTGRELAELSEYLMLLQRKTQARNNMYHQNILFHLILALIYESVNIFKNYLNNSPVKKSRKEGIFSAFSKLVAQHYMTERNIIFYADKMCLTPKYLSNLIKEISGKFAGEWIDDYVILEAKVLLRSTDMTILQISETLNFVTQSRFGTYFKKHVGITPGEFRKINEPASMYAEVLLKA